MVLRVTFSCVFFLCCIVIRRSSRDQSTACSRLLYLATRRGEVVLEILCFVVFASFDLEVAPLAATRRMKRVVSQGNQKSIETTVSHIRLGTVAFESNPRKGIKRKSRYQLHRSQKPYPRRRVE